jgi:ABC-type Zn uptake system ZnuABC Zn-binding protein ZnuA
MNIDNQLKILGFIFLILGPLQVSAEDKLTIIATTHPQVAASLTQIQKLYVEDKLIKNWQAKCLFNEVVNIHDFEPSIDKLKKLKDNSFLIGGPLSHQKWLIKTKAIGLLPEKSLLLSFDKLENDHFWLYPKAACAFEKQVMTFLKENNLIELEANRYCQWVTEETQKLQKLFKDSKINKVIVAHSALIPLMRASGLKTLSLRESDHEKEVTPYTLKKVYQWLNSSKSKKGELETEKILVINEEGYQLPSQVRESKNTIIITWSPIKVTPQPLVSLYQKLKETL